ncbi:MAG TPA: alpha-galactosidase [Candidatus Gemmiger excrementipullorum]|uniref:Alpha-galactosidase n=1 Tax=Candidatus Gemmiger excrementipullorum TaxID=2838610 RepID=A0A9D1Y000_9FIRM|nr:alpha-galactosidase [Candidatus Gemmiger excrementipullorum]
MFGPEAVSPGSDLYRAHPDWALHIPGRETLAIRNQYVLDFSREEVRENIWQQLTALLDACPLPAPARATPCRRCTPAARTKRPTPARPWRPRPAAARFARRGAGLHRLAARAGVNQRGAAAQKPPRQASPR